MVEAAELSFGRVDPPSPFPLFLSGFFFFSVLLHSADWAGTHCVVSSPWSPCLGLPSAGATGKDHSLTAYLWVIRVVEVVCGGGIIPDLFTQTVRLLSKPVT